ncbi:sugar ABC transporter ATP-binding protein [Capillimicrobium parvum]|nr:sugar ABC transporter ATP-binding protein [Capillimicrobium parvum]
MSGDAADRTHVELRGVSKNYGGVQAVRDVSLSIARGSVHAIVGENGAGKSTVSKMIAGVITPSAGELLVNGEPVHFHSPRQALAAGIAMIDQELAMVPARSVMDNVFLGVESRRGGVLNLRAQRARFKELIDRTGFGLPRDVPVGALRVAEQQKVEILRAIARDADLIIMDEPTAPLTQVEAEQLYEIIWGLRDGGTTILYISHFLQEVLQVSDTVTVMRDGLHVSTKPSAQETEASLVRGMLGRSLELNFPERKLCDQSAEPVLEVRDLCAPGRFEDVSFTLRPGEIVGMAGLIGSGRSEVLRAVFGADRVSSGEVLLDGKRVRSRSPRRSIANGLVLLPESRKDDGLVMVRSVADNTVISHLDDVSSGGLMRRDREKAAVAKLMADLDVRTSGADAPIWSLSGGNQQKVLFAKCLMGNPRVMLIDEPTRGVDVGAKRALYDLIVSLAAEGMALLVVSSELEEVLGLAHRVLVMRRGRLVAELPHDEADEETVLAAAFGTEVAA